MPTTDAASAETGTGSTRRRLLGAGLAGSVLGVIGARQASASATTEPSADSTAPAPTEATTTTIAAPRQPTDADVELLAFILTAEMAAAEMYGDAARVEGLEGQAPTLFGVFEEHHRAYGNNIAGRLGKDAVNVANQAVLDEFGAGVSSGDANRARELELALVATHLDALGKLEGVDAAELLASIVVVEGQHVAALAALQGLDPDADFDAFVNETTDPLTSDDYPASA